MASSLTRKPLRVPRKKKKKPKPPPRNNSITDELAAHIYSLKGKKSAKEIALNDIDVRIHVIHDIWAKRVYKHVTDKMDTIKLQNDRIPRELVRGIYRLKNLLVGKEAAEAYSVPLHVVHDIWQGRSYKSYTEDLRCF